MSSGNCCHNNDGRVSTLLPRIMGEYSKLEVTARMRKVAWRLLDHIQGA